MSKSYNGARGNTYFPIPQVLAITLTSHRVNFYGAKKRRSPEAGAEQVVRISKARKKRMERKKEKGERLWRDNDGHLRSLSRSFFHFFSRFRRILLSKLQDIKR
jgi:hypothetical protein